MSRIKHHYIIITMENKEEIKEVHSLAKAIFNKREGVEEECDLITPILESVKNNAYYTFFVSRDGSKKGWNTSNEYDDKRKKFIEYMIENEIEFVEVGFDTDSGTALAERTSNGIIANVKTVDDYI